MTKSYISDDSDQRKMFPMARGLLDYFPAALAEVAYVSVVGNMKHNKGETLNLYHARGKSMDHADCCIRHLADHGEFDDVEVTHPDGRKEIFLVRHSAYLCWRSLALLQQELEDAGARPARAARFPNADGEYNK